MTRTNAWGREVVRDVERNAFGREIVTDPPKTNPWGRPADQPKRNAWGRPITETVRRSAWGRELAERLFKSEQSDDRPETVTSTAPNHQPKVERPATVVREAAVSDPSDPLAPWPADRLLDLTPGTRIAIVRRGRGGRWEPAYGAA